MTHRYNNTYNRDHKYQKSHRTHPNFNIKQNIDRIGEFSLSNTNILNILNNICIINYKKNNTYEKNQEKKEQKAKCSDFFTPKYKNTLFWCWYIYNNGYADYEFNLDKGFRIEEDEKIKIVELLRENKKLLSSYRLKLPDLENNVLFEKMSIETFHALLLIKNINFFYVANKIYYEKTLNDDNDYCIICKNPDDTFSLWNNSKKFPLFMYKSSLLEITNLKKPLKGVSSYKVDELVKMCETLKHNVYNESGKRKTKKELYMLIIKDIY